MWTNIFGKGMNSIIPVSYRLNSITTVFPQGWLWHQLTHEGWYSIKQNIPKVKLYKSKGSQKSTKSLRKKKVWIFLINHYLFFLEYEVNCRIFHNRNKLISIVQIFFMLQKITNYQKGMYLKFLNTKVTFRTPCIC